MNEKEERKHKVGSGATIGGVLVEEWKKTESGKRKHKQHAEPGLTAQRSPLQERNAFCWVSASFAAAESDATLTSSVAALSAMRDLPAGRMSAHARPKDHGCGSGARP